MSRRALILVSLLSLCVAALVAHVHFDEFRYASVKWRNDESLTRLAVSPHRRTALAAVTELRARGPRGLDALLTTYAADVLNDKPGDLSDDVPWTHVRQAIDQVAQQRDAHASGLYWYTDLDAARAAAGSQKPILSLRLLGKLSEELSCANSRFFRTVLYPNPRVAELLRHRFVLHWQSVRPAPRMTVDFGDGRVLETTITGNSIHYILTPDGRPVDALPGLYGAEEFARGLERAGQVALRVANAQSAEAEAILADYHAQRLVDLDTELARDLAAVGVDVSEVPVPKLAQGGGGFTVWPEGSKNRVELPMIQAMVPGIRPLLTTLDDQTWSKIATLHASSTVLDERSRALMRGKKLGREGRLVADGDEVTGVTQVQPLFESLRRSVAEDQVRNEQVFHRAVHGWYVDGTVGTDLDALNRRVYRDLFLADQDDGWLGIVSPTTYDGIDHPVDELPGRS